MEATIKISQESGVNLNFILLRPGVARLRLCMHWRVANDRHQSEGPQSSRGTTGDASELYTARFAKCCRI